MKNKCENCGECCLKTEMILSNSDTESIMKNSPKILIKEDFAFINKDGFFQLKNVKNHCIFLDFPLKQCKIYEYRPQGCRFYPLIFNFQEKKCIFDKDCPRSNLFYQKNTELKSKCKNLRRFLIQELGLK
jgi:Fe-S-cluster containining protein